MSRRGARKRNTKARRPDQGSTGFPSDVEHGDTVPAPVWASSDDETPPLADRAASGGPSPHLDESPVHDPGRHAAPRLEAHSGPGHHLDRGLGGYSGQGASDRDGYAAGGGSFEPLAEVRSDEGPRGIARAAFRRLLRASRRTGKGAESSSPQSPVAGTEAAEVRPIALEGVIADREETGSLTGGRAFESSALGEDSWMRLHHQAVGHGEARPTAGGWPGVESVDRSTPAGPHAAQVALRPVPPMVPYSFTIPGRLPV